MPRKGKKKDEAGKKPADVGSERAPAAGGQPPPLPLAAAGPPPQHAPTDPLRAGSGVSALRDPARAGKEAGARALAAAGLERADVAFVFATTAHAGRYQAILDAVSEETSAISIVGCDGAGVLVQDRQIEGGAGVAVLVAGGGGLVAEAGLLPTADAEQLGQALGTLARGSSLAASTSDRPAIFLFPDAGGIEHAPFFAGLELAAGAVPVFGAVSGASAEEGDQAPGHQFAGGQVVAGRTATLILQGAARLFAAVAPGCRPIGRPLVITQCDGAGIRRLAGRPAVDELLAAAAHEGLALAQEEPIPIDGGLAIDPRKHPLGLGDFVVTSIAGVGEDGDVMAFSAQVRVGQTFQFQRRDAVAAQAGLEAALDDLERRTAGMTRKFGLYFAGESRGHALFGGKDREVAAIRKRFPDLPVAGFFGRGEIAPIDGVNRAHARAGVLVVYCE